MVRILVVCGAIGLAPAAVAEPALDASQLGHMRAVVELCSAAMPLQASHYLLQMKANIGDATRAEMQKVERTEEYRQSYESVRSELSGLAPEQRAAACRSYLAAVQ